MRKMQSAPKEQKLQSGNSQRKTNKLNEGKLNGRSKEAESTKCGKIGYKLLGKIMIYCPSTNCDFFNLIFGGCH
jgi:hypothetical protein